MARCPSVKSTLRIEGSLAGALLASVLLSGPHAEAQPAQHTPEVVQAFPHDPGAFTQGLLYFEGKLYESTGLEGRSSLRRVDLQTGQVERSVSLDPTFFGEGLARVERRLYQLTWRNGVALEYDLDTFAELRRFTYAGEGWGLCYDGQALVMSDGSDKLTFRNAQTFAEVGSVRVKRAGVPVQRLNELECARGLVFSNVWMTDTIVVIDPKSGEVLMDMNLAGLLTQAERANADVLNGIAHQPETDRFYVTGKLWPKLFEVKVPAVPGAAPAKPPSPPASTPARPRGCWIGASGPASAGGGFSALVLVGLLGFRRRAAQQGRMGLG
jgi:glutamine cyclotransferase